MKEDVKIWLTFKPNGIQEACIDWIWDNGNKKCLVDEELFVMYMYAIKLCTKNIRCTKQEKRVYELLWGRPWKGLPKPLTQQLCEQEAFRLFIKLRQLSIQDPFHIYIMDETKIIKMFDENLTSEQFIKKWLVMPIYKNLLFKINMEYK